MKEEPQNLGRITPELMAEWLTYAGFTKFGGREGMYSWWRWPEAHSNRALLLPVDTTAPEYEELMTACLKTLRDLAMSGARAAAVFGRAWWEHDAAWSPNDLHDAAHAHRPIGWKYQP